MKTISEFHLERFVLSELPPEKMKEIEAELKVDPALQLRLEQIREKNKQFLEENSEDWFAHSLNTKLGSQQSLETSPVKTPWFLKWSPVLACLVVMALLPGMLADKHGLDGIRTKGLQPVINLYKKDMNGVIKLDEYERVSEGDQLQVIYNNPENKKLFGLILSIDGKGVETNHLSRGETSSVSLKNGKTSLETSYELDDAPASEVFYFVYSNQQFAWEDALVRVREIHKELDIEESDGKENKFIRNGLYIQAFVLLKKDRDL